jgi:hypothetical protein
MVGPGVQAMPQVLAIDYTFEAEQCRDRLKVNWHDDGCICCIQRHHTRPYKKRIRKKRWAVASKIFPYEKQEEK